MRSHKRSDGRGWSENHAERPRTGHEAPPPIHREKHYRTKDSRNLRYVAEDPAGSSAQPQHMHTPQASHHQRTTIYRFMKAPDGTRIMIRKATREDADRYNVPDDYDLQNWDPNERPIYLLGTVFDANSLGKWLYDWTTHTHGVGSTPEMIAGNLWGLLIQLASKVTLSEQFILHHTRSQSSYVRSEDFRTVDEFLGTGNHLMRILQQLIKGCEEPMLEKWNLEPGNLGPVPAVEFVRYFLTHEGCLDRTEKFIQRLQSWIAEWNASCGNTVRAFASQGH